MKNVKMICITGGTCAGKTSVFEKLKEDICFNNLQVFYIPESATEVMQRGIKPFENNVGLSDFQILNLQNQLFRENFCKKAAEKVSADNVLIICDRSSYEQQVFLDNLSIWKDVCIANKVEEKDLMNSYDAVFHLVSTAIGAEYAYGMLTNKNRIHTLEEAREQELKAQKIWKEHKNFQIFDNSVTFDEKINNVINSVKKYIIDNFENVEEIFVVN